MDEGLFVLEPMMSIEQPDALLMEEGQVAGASESKVAEISGGAVGGDVLGAAGGGDGPVAAGEAVAELAESQEGEGNGGAGALEEKNLLEKILEKTGYVAVEESDSDEEDDEVEEEEEIRFETAVSSSGEEESSSSSGSSSSEEEELKMSNSQPQAGKRQAKQVSSSKAKGDSSDDDVVDPPGTKNEMAALPAVSKVEAVLEDRHELHALGTVTTAMDKHVVVQTSASVSTVAHVLNEGSILWLSKERVPLGFVDEVFGPVKNPFYVVRFNSEADVPEGAVESAEVSYVSEFATFVLDKDPDLYRKGYDASGCNDEELSDGEIEFSDDEKEAAYKKGTVKRSKDFQGRDEVELADGEAEGKTFAPQVGDRPVRGGRGKGQQRGRSRFGEQHKMPTGGASSDLADMAVRRIADMDLQLPSTSPYQGKGRNSDGKAQKGGYSRPPMGRRKFRSRSDASESESMSTKRDASASSASGEVFGKRSPYAHSGGFQQGHMSGMSFHPGGWGQQGNAQAQAQAHEGHGSPFPGQQNPCFGMQFPPPQILNRPPQGASPAVPPGSWPPAGLANGGARQQPMPPNLYQHPGFGNFIPHQQAQPIAVGPAAFGPHYGMPLQDPASIAATAHHAGPGGFYSAPGFYGGHLQTLAPHHPNFVNHLGFIQQPGNVSQAGYGYPQGSLVYIDSNPMRQHQSGPNSAASYSQIPQPGNMIYGQNQTPLPSVAFNSNFVRQPFNDDYARRNRHGP